MAKKRMNLELSEEFDSTLEKLKEVMGKTSKAEVIRSAVTLLKYAKDQEARGGRLAITSDQGDIDTHIVVA